MNIIFVIKNHLNSVTIEEFINDILIKYDPLHYIIENVYLQVFNSRSNTIIFDTDFL